MSVWFREPKFAIGRWSLLQNVVAAVAHLRRSALMPSKFWSERCWLVCLPGNLLRSARAVSLTFAGGGERLDKVFILWASPEDALVSHWIRC